MPRKIGGLASIRDQDEWDLGTRSFIDKVEQKNIEGVIFMWFEK